MEWFEAIDQLKPYVVRISTPSGSGTGWLVSRSTTSSLCAIATAGHVIDHAHYWEEPIRLHHTQSGQSVVLRAPDRSIHLESQLDSAGLIFDCTTLPLPDLPIELVPKDKFVVPGVEIGWLGFPAIPRADLCFFSGRISAFIEADSAYMVDGVAINGVSGGPAFNINGGELRLLGIVSAYIPNRATGDALPGVAVVRDATQFHDLTERFRDFDDAKKQESPPANAAPSEVTEGEPPIKTLHK
ncbi:S1 family peptidase [Usitatibacter palustris]|uniref:Trypsin-like peptidase domain-containing protein n=1 Tax=Usitatibacter palustris TaxID=2732487 RepID=A0A6M4HDX8_9PROT|nr:serine protease [Usitatibacter palustris]QJR16713.1 hypothetical protein DSM104440_03549 [Usitatibacter palustris]